MEAKGWIEVIRRGFAVKSETSMNFMVKSLLMYFIINYAGKLFKGILPEPGKYINIINLEVR